MTRILRTMMRDLGYQTIETSGPDQAIQAIENHPTEIDLVLSELSLPELSGRKLASFISKRRPAVTIVLLCDENVPNRDSTPHGAVYLNKPFTREQLAGAISAQRQRG